MNTQIEAESQKDINMQSKYDFLVEQVNDLDAYLDKTAMNDMDRDIIYRYIKSIKSLAEDIRDFNDKRDELPDEHIFSEKSWKNMVDSLNNLNIRK